MHASYRINRIIASLITTTSSLMDRSAGHRVSSSNKNGRSKTTLLQHYQQKLATTEVARRRREDGTIKDRFPKCIDWKKSDPVDPILWQNLNNRNLSPSHQTCLTFCWSNRFAGQKFTCILINTSPPPAPTTYAQPPLSSRYPNPFPSGPSLRHLAVVCKRLMMILSTW